MTGSVPGIPKQTGQVCVLAGRPNSVPHSQNIFDCVRSWAWTSSPITTSYGMRKPGLLLLHRGQPLALTPHCFTACLKRFCQDGLVVGYEFAALIHRLVQGLAGLSGQDRKSTRLNSSHDQIS